jgi:hypothetical protein
MRLTVCVKNGNGLTLNLVLCINNGLHVDDELWHRWVCLGQQATV